MSAIDLLTIDDSHRLKREVKQLKEENTRIAELRTEFEKWNRPPAAKRLENRTGEQDLQKSQP